MFFDSKKSRCSWKFYSRSSSFRFQQFNTDVHLCPRRRYYFKTQRKPRFAPKKLRDAHDPYSSSETRKNCPGASYILRSSRAPSYLTNIAHLPRNVTTSSELSRRSSFAHTAYRENRRFIREISRINFFVGPITRPLHGSNFTWRQAHVCHSHLSAFRENSENGSYK